MSEVEGKLKWLQAVVLDQWKSGYAAELRLCCENGHLRVSLDADFGPPTSSWRTASVSASSVTSGRGSPSRVRRRQKRAAARSAANNADVTATGKTAEDKTVAEKTASEKTAAENSAADRIAAEKTAVERTAAEWTAAEKSAAEKAATEKEATEKAVAEKEVAEEKEATVKEAAEREAAEKEAASDHVASTSNAGRQFLHEESCRNCNGEMSKGHQCDIKDEICAKSAPALLQLVAKTDPPKENISSSSPVPSDAETVAPPRRRGLNINTFCVKCEKRHPVWQRCQCQSVTSVATE